MLSEATKKQCERCHILLGLGLEGLAMMLCFYQGHLKSCAAKPKAPNPRPETEILSPQNPDPEVTKFTP